MKVILIDGKNAGFRFSWVYRNLRDEDGRPTGAVYGLLRLLLGLKKKHPDARFVWVWDGERTEKNWRVQLYPGYKHRTGEKPQAWLDLRDQIPAMEDALRVLRIPAIKVPDVEADDMVGMFSTVCRLEDWQPVIYSNDLDYAQLMQYGIDLIRGSHRDNPYALTSEREITYRFGCPLEHVLRVRCLMGDPSDKIPKPMRGMGLAAAAHLVVQEGIRPENPTANGVGNLYWETIHRNWKLMRIVRSWNDPVYAPQKNQIKAELQKARLALKGAQKPDPAILTGFLVEGQYESLLKERKSLILLNVV